MRVQFVRDQIDHCATKTVSANIDSISIIKILLYFSVVFVKKFLVFLSKNTVLEQGNIVQRVYQRWITDKDNFHPKV
jgi:hypothetical protein